MVSQQCVFCSIVREELPSYKIVENESVFGFLDLNPCVEGHCLIIPKRHVRHWHQLDDEETAALFNTAKKVAKRMEKVFGADFICVFIRGGRVEHVHVVLVPSHEGDRLSGFPQSVLGTPKINLREVHEKLCRA